MWWVYVHSAQFIPTTPQKEDLVAGGDEGEVEEEEEEEEEEEFAPHPDCDSTILFTTRLTGGGR